MFPDTNINLDEIASDVIDGIAVRYDGRYVRNPYLDINLGYGDYEAFDYMGYEIDHDFDIHALITDIILETLRQHHDMGGFYTPILCFNGERFLTTQEIIATEQTRRFLRQ